MLFHLMAQQYFALLHISKRSKTIGRNKIQTKRSHCCVHLFRGCERNSRHLRINFLQSQKPFFIQLFKQGLKYFRCLQGLTNLVSLYYLYPTYPHGPPIMYHLPQLFVPVFPEKCKQNYLPSSLYRGKLFSRPSLGQWGEIMSERAIYFCTLLFSQEFSKNFNKTSFL